LLGEVGGVKVWGNSGTAVDAPLRSWESQAIGISRPLESIGGFGKRYGSKLILFPNLRQSSNQCGNTGLHLRLLSGIARQVGLFMLRATTWVTNLVNDEEYKPPIARTPPRIASLSPAGISSAHKTTTSVRKSDGSGLNCRGFAALFLSMDVVTQAGLTTWMNPSTASWYAGKSEVVEIR